MADWGQIIAGIDGYRNYENNRALDLQNQAQLIQNQANDIRKNEMMTINDIKGKIAALSDNPYAKLNAWDPQARGQQLLNEDKQLKIASKWASSIKNLAPEKRAQGYAQFLRAMPGLGIDVSDMPQAYDEAYINQLADLGIETETRYQNEQQNARQDKQIAATQANLERQIAANREARQDEFNKKLAAFDYENSYRTQAEKDKQAQIDSMIDASTLSPDDKERAKLAYRNITLPGVKTPQERLMEQFTNPDATDEQRAAARQGLMRIAELQKEIKDLEPVKPVSAKDKASAMNYVSSAVKEGTMTPEQGSAYYEGLTGDSVDFSTPTKKYAAGDVGTMQFLMDNGYSADGARQAVGKATPEEKLQIEQEKSDINTASAIKINAAKAQDDRDTKVIMAGINADNAELQAQRNFAREQQLIALKDSLPTPKQKEISAAAQALGIPEKQLYQMSLNKQQAEIDLSKKRGELVNAQINQTLANTEKTQKEAETAGMSNLEKNIKALQNPQTQEWLKNNPWAEPYLGNKGTTVNIDNKGESEYTKQTAKQNAQNKQEYIKAANDAASTIYSIDNMIKAIKNEDVYQGTAGQMVNSYKRLLSSMGKDVKGMSDAAILDSGKSLLLGKIRRDVMSGTTSDRDINFLVDMVPSLGKTKEQNLAIAEMYKKTYQRQVDAGRFVNDYTKHNNGRWDDEGERLLTEFLNKPLFTEAEKARASGIPESEINNATPTNESYDFSNVADEDLF